MSFPTYVKTFVGHGWYERVLTRRSGEVVLSTHRLISFYSGNVRFLQQRRCKQGFDLISSIIYGCLWRARMSSSWANVKFLLLCCLHSFKSLKLIYDIDLVRYLTAKTLGVLLFTKANRILKHARVWAQAAWLCCLLCLAVTLEEWACFHLPLRLTMWSPTCMLGTSTATTLENIVWWLDFELPVFWFGGWVLWLCKFFAPNFLWHDCLWRRMFSLGSRCGSIFVSFNSASFYYRSVNCFFSDRLANFFKTSIFVVK